MRWDCFFIQIQNKLKTNLQKKVWIHVRFPPTTTLVMCLLSPQDVEKMTSNTEPQLTLTKSFILTGLSLPQVYVVIMLKTMTATNRWDFCLSTKTCFCYINAFCLGYIDNSVYLNWYPEHVNCIITLRLQCETLEVIHNFSPWQNKISPIWEYWLSSPWVEQWKFKSK